MCPGYHWYPSFRIHFNKNIRRKNLKKNISIPARYRYGFCKFCLKNTLTDVLSPIYVLLSLSCFKNSKKGQKTITIPHQYSYGFCKNEIKYQKPYLYLIGIDMVFWKFRSKKQPNRCAIPFLWVRYVLLSWSSFQNSNKRAKNHIYTTPV